MNMLLLSITVVDPMKMSLNMILINHAR